MTIVTRIKTNVDLRRWQLQFRRKGSNDTWNWAIPEFDASHAAAYESVRALNAQNTFLEFSVVEQIGDPQYI